MAKTFTNLTVANATAGNAILASDHAAAFTTLNSHTVPPSVRLQRSGDLSYSSGSAIAWNNASAVWDTENTASPSDPMWSSSANTRITIRTAGIYLVTASVFATFTGTVTVSDVWIKSSVNTYEAMHYHPYSNSSGNIVIQASTIVSASVGTWFEAYLDASGGASLTIKDDASGKRTFFSATWLGKTS